MRLGADPEVFLKDQSGKHISAIGFINADKWHPLQIEGMPQGFTLQEDNVALEYGIPPASSAGEFISHIQDVMEMSRKWVPTLSFSKLSCTIFDKDQMAHPAAHIFGCEPDWNSWTGKTNRKPKPPHEYMRSAGGHVHVETELDPMTTSCYMDLYLSVPAVFMDPTGAARKVAYGRAGACRPKPYGVEYRSLSNFWIFEKSLIQWVWDETFRALNSTVDIRSHQERIERSINTNDKALAAELINEFNLKVI
jgi:hypothetical protein